MPGCADAGPGHAGSARPAGAAAPGGAAAASPPTPLPEGVGGANGGGSDIADGLRQTLPYGFCLRPPRRTVGNPPWQIPRNATQSWSLKAGS